MNTQVAVTHRTTETLQAAITGHVSAVRVKEWFRDWAGPLADAAREVTVWYLAEVPKVTDTVGIAENEAALVRAAMAG